MSLSMFMDQVCTHERATAVKDAIGGNAPTFATQTSEVPCALWPANSTLARTFARRDIVGTHLIASTVNVNAKSKDRFDIGGVKYLVVGSDTFSNGGVSGEVLYLYDVTDRTV